MLLTTVLLWSLSVVATRYSLAHGFLPIAFSALRQVGSASVLAGVCLRAERTLAVGHGHGRLIVAAATLGFLNQLCFVYAVDLSTASTVGMMLGTIPILTALILAAAGIERLSRRIGTAAIVSFAGVALVTTGSGPISGGIAGVGLALLTALTWAAYSVTIARLTLYWSPLRVSALVMLAFTPPLVAAAASQFADLAYTDLDWTVWACVGGVALGTVLSTLMWFSGLERVGASRASLWANLQPFFIVVLGVALLSEPLTPAMAAGGAAIAAGIAIAWRRTPRLAADATAGARPAT